MNTEDHSKFIQFFLNLGHKAKDAVTEFSKKMKQEGTETGEAAEYVGKYLKGEKLTDKEGEAVKQQFYDILKMLGIGIPFALIPGASILMPILIKVASKYNINLMPSSFSKKEDLKEASEPKIFYHGSNYKFDKFNIAKVEGALEQEGPGIYLTSSIEDAKRYGSYIYKVQWTGRRTISNKPMSEAKLRQFAKPKTLIRHADDWKQVCQNFDEDYVKGFNMCVEQLYETSDSLKDFYLSIWGDFYKTEPEKFCYVMNYWANIDGIVIDRGGGLIHIVAYNPKQIKILEITENKRTQDFNEAIMNELQNFTDYFNTRTKKLQEKIKK